MAFGTEIGGVSECYVKNYFSSMTDNSIPFIFKTNLKKRIFATLLDYGLFLIFFYVYIMYFGYENDEGGKTVSILYFSEVEKTVSGLLALPIPVVWFIYFVAVESIFGGTLAHIGFDLAVLTTDRNEIGIVEALKRHLLDPIDFLFYGIPAIIAIKNSDKHQRIGDMWARTIVVDMSDTEQYIER